MTDAAFEELHEVFRMALAQVDNPLPAFNFDDYIINGIAYSCALDVVIYKISGVYHVDHDGYEDVMEFDINDVSGLAQLLEQLIAEQAEQSMDEDDDGSVGS